MLLREVSSNEMSLIDLAEQFNYFDNFGYQNTRLSTVQVLIGVTADGIYDAHTMQAINSALSTLNADFNNDNPVINKETLESLK